MQITSLNKNVILNNITQEQFDTRAFVIHPIKRLLQATLEDYPLKDHQKSLIDVDFNYDFPIWKNYQR